MAINIQFANDAKSTLLSAISAVATSLTIQAGDGSLYPSLSGSKFFYITLQNAAGTREIVKVEARAGDILSTLTRAQEGTTAIAFSAGDKVDLRLTAQGLEDKINQEIVDDLANSPIITEPEIINGFKATPNVLADAAKTLVVADGWNFIITPTATRVLTLPTTSVKAGNIIHFTNLASAQRITVNASAGATILDFQNGFATFIALQDSPTTPAHWRLLEARGDANPAFFAHRNGTVQDAITSIDQVEFNDDSTFPGFDTCLHYDTTLFRFTPKIPGKYLISARIKFTDIQSGDAVEIILEKNSTQIATKRVTTSSTIENLSLTLPLDANGTADFFEVFAANLNRNTSKISGDKIASYFTGFRIA